MQTCEQGETAWVQVAADGEDADALDAPAPLFTVTEPEPESEPQSESEPESGEDEPLTADPARDGSGENAEDDDTQAVSADGSGSGMSWGIAGLIAGLIGAVLGGLALIRTRRQA